MRTWIILVMLLAYTASWAQQNLSGTIIDSESGEPLEQVSVYFPELEVGTITDEKGFFTFSNLPTGIYKLTVSYLGYITYSESIDLNLEPSLEINMISSPIEMQEVIVSTPFHKLQRENVMKVEKVQLEAIKKAGAPTLIEGLQTIPGVSNVSTGVGIGKPVIRGLSSNRVVVYSQHIRLENQQFGDEHGLGLSGNGLESVELIKGPASLLYGSDALGGVLYLNPERFAAPNSAQGNMNLDYFSNSRGYSADGAYKGSGEKFKYLFRIGGSSHADYQDGNGLRITNTRFEDQDFKAGIGYQSGKFKTDFRYNFNHSALGLPEEVGLQSTDREPLEPNQELDNHMLSSRSSYFFNRSSLTLTLGYSQNDRKEFEEHEEEEPIVPETGPEEAALDMKLQTLSYNLQYHLPSKGKLETVVGLQGMRQENENFGEEVLIPDAITQDVGIMATSHLHFEKSDLQLGLRYDNRSIDGEVNGIPEEEGYIAPVDVNFNSVNLALGYRTDLSENVIGRLNLASGFRAPNLAELTSNGVHEGTNRYEIGNADLDNEKNLQLDLSLEYVNEHVEIAVNGFYNSINDFIYIEPTGTMIDDTDVFLYQQQDASLYGGEFGIHFHPHPLDLLHIESTFQTVIGELDDASDIPLIPANSWLNTVRLESGKKDAALEKGYVFVSWRAVFDQNRVSFNETPTDGYNVINIGTGAQLAFIDEDLSLRLSLNNVFNESYIDHLSRLKAEGIQNIGRNLHVGMSWTF